MNEDYDMRLVRLEPTFLTTIDNPYDPNTHYVEWFAWDQEQGYNTSEYIARLLPVYVDEEHPYLDHLIELAKLEILDNDMTGLYKLVKVT